MSWELYGDKNIRFICLRLTFEEIPHKKIWVSWGVWFGCPKRHRDAVLAKTIFENDTYTTETRQNKWKITLFSSMQRKTFNYKWKQLHQRATRDMNLVTKFNPIRFLSLPTFGICSLHLSHFISYWLISDRYIILILAKCFNYKKLSSK